MKAGAVAAAARRGLLTGRAASRRRARCSGSAVMASTETWRMGCSSHSGTAAHAAPGPCKTQPYNVAQSSICTYRLDYCRSRQATTCCKPYASTVMLLLILLRLLLLLKARQDHCHQTPTCCLTVTVKVSRLVGQSAKHEAHQSCILHTEQHSSVHILTAAVIGRWGHLARLVMPRQPRC